MAAVRAVIQLQVYLTPRDSERLQALAKESCLPVSAIMRAGVSRFLDEIEAAPERILDLVRPHVREPGRPRRRRRARRNEPRSKQLELARRNTDDRRASGDQT